MTFSSQGDGRAPAPAQPGLLRSMNNRVEIQNLTARYGDTVAIRDVSITLEASQFITVLGPSGCGKTTLLRVLAGFAEYDGRVLIDGVRIDGVPPHKRGIGIVFQDYALFAAARRAREPVSARAFGGPAAARGAGASDRHQSGLAVAR